MRRFWLLGGTLAFAACAPTTNTPTISAADRDLEQQKQFELVLEDNRRHTERAHRIYTRIARANVDSCPNVRALMGVHTTEKQSFKGNELIAAIKVYNLVVDHPMVFYSAADAVQIGDFVTKVEGKPVSRAAEIGKFAPAGEGPVNMTVLRNGKEIDVVVPRVRQCGYGLKVVNQSMVNAFATGADIIFTTGMMQYASTDDELALVMGHEMAHNVEDHVDKQKGNQFAGMLLGAVIGGATGIDMTSTFGRMGAMAFSQEFEAEADYVGMYYAAKAGFGIKDAPKFWRKMAVQNPNAIAHGTTHPDTASRFLALEKTVEEIEGKRAAGKPLLPERKIGQVSDPQAAGTEEQTPEQEARNRRRADCLAAYSATPRRCDQY